MADDIRTTIHTLDAAAEGRLFDTPTVVAVTQILDQDGLAILTGDTIAIIALLAGVILCVSIGV